MRGQNHPSFWRHCSVPHDRRPQERGWVGVSLVALVTVVVVAMLGTGCGDDGAGGVASDGPGTTLPTVPGDGDRSAAVHEFVVIDAGGPLTKEALASGDVDVAVLFTSSAGEAEHGWVHLVDDKGLQPAEHFVAAVHEAALTPELGDLLALVTAQLTETRVQAMMDRILADEESVASVAREYVEGFGTFRSVTGAYTVGRAGFAESALAAEIYAAALESAGATVVRTPDLGFREVYFPAVESGEVDVMPEFVGALLAHLGGKPTSELAPSLGDLRDRAAARGVAILEPAPAESKDGLYVTAATAARFGLETISDLAAVTQPLRFGGPAECPQRDLCLVGLRDVYGLQFRS